MPGHQEAIAAALDFPDFGDNTPIDLTGSQTFDLGNGVILVLGPNGEFIDVRSTPTAPQAPQGPFTGITEGERQQIAQADRDLAARIENDKAQLEESKRQFSISSGLRREELAAQVKHWENQLRNDLTIAKLDSRTRLTISKLQASVDVRGQNIQERLGLGDLSLRASEIAVNRLGQDPVQQALFAAGRVGTAATPLSAFNQQEDQRLRDLGVDVTGIPGSALAGIPGAAGGATLNLKGKPTAVIAGEAGRPEVVVTDKDRVHIIPIAGSAQAGATINTGGANIQDQLLDTLRGAIEESATGGRAPAFGGLPEIRVPGTNQVLRSPSQLGRRILGLRPSDPRRLLLLSAFKAAGLNTEDVLARARAATPAAVFSGITRRR